MLEREENRGISKINSHIINTGRKNRRHEHETNMTSGSTWRSTTNHFQKLSS